MVRVNNELGIAMHMLDKGLEGDLKRIASSKHPMIYALSLFVPDALRRILVWVSAAATSMVTFYLVLTPLSSPNYWSFLPLFVIPSTLMWLAYGWMVFLGIRASPTQLRIRWKLLSRVYLRGRSFYDLNSDDRRKLFPLKPRTRFVSFNTFVFWERAQKWIALGSMMALLGFYLAWVSGVAGPYLPVAPANVPAGSTPSVASMALFLVSFFGFLSPMLVSFPLVRWMAQRITPEDRDKFAEYLERTEHRVPTIYDIPKETVIEMIRKGVIDSWLDSKRVFKRLGFLSLWNYEEFGTAIVFGGLFTLMAFSVLLLRFPVDMLTIAFSIPLSLTLGLLASFLFMIADVLSDSTKRKRGAAMKLMIKEHSSVADVEGLDVEHVAGIYDALTTEGEDDDSSQEEEVTLREAFKPFAQLTGMFAILLPLGIGMLAFARFTEVFPALGVIILGLMFFSASIWGYNKMSKVPVTEEDRARLAIRIVIRIAGEIGSGA